MDVMRQAAQNLDIEDTVRGLSDEHLQTFANCSVMLTPFAASVVLREVDRRLREMRGT